MGVSNISIIITVFLTLMGIICLFRPFLLIYLFAIIPVVKFIPKLPPDDNVFRILQLGTINIFVLDFLIFILFLLIAVYSLRNCVIKKQSFLKIFEGQIAKVILIVFLWNIFIGALSYLKGFNAQNILRHFAMESLSFITILPHLTESINNNKERFFKFSIILGLTLVTFAILKYSVFHEVGITSSGTIRTVRANAVVIFMLPICYILFYSSFWRNQRILSLIVILLFTIGINFTGHRSGWVVFLFAISMYFFSKDFKILEYLWVPFLSIVIFASVIFIVPKDEMVPSRSLITDFVLRFNDTFNIQNSTTQDRLSVWEYSIEIIKEKPLLGLGRYPIYTAHMDDEKSNKNLQSFTELKRGAHNIVINKIIHEGFLGLSIIIIFFYVILKELKKVSLPDRRYATFLKVYILSFILFSMFNTSFTSVMGRTFFFIVLGFLNSEIIKVSQSKQFNRQSPAIHS